MNDLTKRKFNKFYQRVLIVILGLILVLCMGGCSDYIRPAMHEFAEEKCNKNNGYVYFYLYAGKKYMEITCNDGAVFDVKIPKQS